MAIGEPGRLVNGRNDEAMADIQIAVAVVKGRIEWIGVTEAECVIGLREGRAEIVCRVREGVIRGDVQSRVMQVVALELDIHRVVVGIATGAAVVGIGVLRIETRQTVIGSCESIRQGIAQKSVTAAEAIDVLDVIQVDTARAGILQGDDSAGSELVLNGSAVELGLRSANVLINVAQTGWRKWDAA